MAIAKFQFPDGRIGRFEVPDGTTPEQAQALIEQAVSAMGVQAAPETTAQPAAQPAAAPETPAQPPAQATAEPLAQPTAQPTTQPTGEPTALPPAQAMPVDLTDTITQTAAAHKLLQKHQSLKLLNKTVGSWAWLVMLVVG
jgi:hypothetical protein